MSEKRPALAEFIDGLVTYHIPRYAELPDLPLYMDQVVVLMERYLAPLAPGEEKPVTPAMINNYVKQGVIPAPVNKKYEKRHLAYLVVVFILKQVLSISEIRDVIEQETQDGEIYTLYDGFCADQEDSFHAAAEIMKESRGQMSDEKLALQLAMSACAQRTAVAQLMKKPEMQHQEKKKEKKEKDK